MSAPNSLEYARYHALARPLPSLTDLAGCLTICKVDDEPHRAVRLFNTGCPVLDEKLKFSREGMQYLAEATKAPYALKWHQIHDTAITRRALKVEQPLLIRDHERDLTWFRRGLNIPRILNELRDSRSPPILERASSDTIDNECQQAAQAVKEAIRNPQYEILTEAMMLSLRLIPQKQAPVHPTPRWDLPDRKKLVFIDPPTPLLTPLLPSVEPEFLPDMPSMDVDPRSEPVEVDNLLQILENRVRRDEHIVTSDMSNASPAKVRHVLQSATQAPETPHPQDARIIHDQQASKKPPESKIPAECPVQALPLQEVPPAALDDYDEVFSGFINIENPPEARPASSDRGMAALPERADSAGVAYPCLQAADLALQIPTVDEGPSLGVSLCPLDLLRDSAISTSSTSPQLDAKLSWVPFSQDLIKHKIKEQLELPRQSTNYLAVPKGTPSSRDLVWKQPGLRVLDASTDENELTAADVQFLDPAGPETPQIAGRKRRLAEEEDAISPTPLVTTVHDSMMHVPALLPTPQPHMTLVDPQQPGGKCPDERPQMVLDQPKKKRRVVNDALPRQSGQADPTPSFSASTALSSFLDLRAGRFKRPDLPDIEALTSIKSTLRDTDSSSDPIQSSQALMTGLPGNYLRRPPVLEKMQDQPNDPIIVSQAVNDQYPVQVEVPATQPQQLGVSFNQLPKYETISEPRIIIVDERLVQNKQLMSILDGREDSQVRSIYRKLDFAPDIILNPNSCLVQTNLQALKQKSLPGTKVSSIQDRIRSLCDEYEHIFVLIAIPSSSTASTQQQTITDFTCFCAALQLAIPSLIVSPIWIVLPPPATRPQRPIKQCDPEQPPVLDPITAWTWHIIHRYSQRVLPTMSFIDDTTVWELFLRQAGVNALAAQVMLGMLKADRRQGIVGVDSEESLEVGNDVAMDRDMQRGQEVWGLRRLVSMGEQERSVLFEELVGKNCLRRMDRAFNGI